jgi:hypothetical protein
MKYRFLLLLIIPFLLNCPKKISPGSRKKIEIYYLGSVTEDLNRIEPYLSGTASLKGIKIGYLDATGSGYGRFLGKLGLYELLNEMSLDFLITDDPVYGMNFFPISKAMGYGFKNIEGIRFAVVSLGKDSLTISDKIKISVIQERSDVQWIIEKNTLNRPPFKIDFLVRKRTLQDTNLTSIKIKPDPERTSKIVEFARSLTSALAVPIALGDQTLAEYALQRMAGHEGAAAILYSASLFRDPNRRAPMAVRDLVNQIDGTAKFAIKEMTKENLLKTQSDNKYLLWGTVGKDNSVLIPDPGGKDVLDLLLD